MGLTDDAEADRFVHHIASDWQQCRFMAHVDRRPLRLRHQADAPRQLRWLKADIVTLRELWP